jgi:N utilization substance protein B
MPLAPFSNMETINLSEDRSKGKYTNRSLARTVAFQMLYQDDLNSGSREQFTESFLKQELPDYEPLLRFARTLINGTAEKKEQIDTFLANAAQHWSLSRMNVTDRSILRIAVYEILFMDTPKPIVINEAVELAKKFGTEQSASFVNGILDKVIDTKKVIKNG